MKKSLNKLMKLLSEYVPHDEQERKLYHRFTDFITRQSDCLDRSNPSGHLTASCLLFDPSEEEVLLTHHKKIGAWLQLGGHADGDNDLLRVALKEAFEESGILGIKPWSNEIFDLDIHGIHAHGGVAAHLHYDVRFVLQAPHRQFLLSDESNALAWVPINKLIDDQQIDESLRRLARKWVMRSLNQ